MKKLPVLLSVIILNITLFNTFSFAAIKNSGGQKVSPTTAHSNVKYFNFNQDEQVPFSYLNQWINKTFHTGAAFGLTLLNSNTDELGITTYRYQQTWDEIPVQGTMWLVHVKNDKIISCNGVLFPSLTCPVNQTITALAALDLAINYVHADTYQWQNAGAEQMIKYQTNNPQATYYPAGVLMFAPSNGQYAAGNFRLTYRFDIYATTPLSRQFIFVDALTGQVIYALNQICTSNTTGTAYTGYLGVKTITTDSYSGGYRLRETGRGNGIETYNLQQGSTLQNVDFTDADNIWNNVNANFDQYATDAHYGAEMTYDYYKTKLNRNSVDNAGLKLLSYVHYGSQYDNAFWDGREMNYGDGDGVNYTPFTTIDVTGHEISHGVTQYTCGLVYQYEPGALNEGYSDCMGTSVEFYGDAVGADWLIGEDLGTPFRNMADPKQYGQPDTYYGQNWYLGGSDNGGVHTNSGGLNYWFYLISVGGSGTNDNGNSYNITGLTLDKADKILYRAWSVYMTSTSQYLDARASTLQAAIDLYGACGPEVQTVTNAWYAVGVGNAFSPGVQSDFAAGAVSFCKAPATVVFKNHSNNASTFKWYFSDGATSTATNPTHTYTSIGNYTVKLVSNGGSCGTDSITKTSYISVNSSNPCLVELPVSGKGATQKACIGTLYDDGGPDGRYTDQSDSWMTIAPTGANGLKLSFTSFAYEDGYDYMYIYDGPDTNSALIGRYTGYNVLPGSGGVIYATGGSVTIRTISDQLLDSTGFGVNWQCLNTPPIVSFTSDAIQTCTGTISFKDKTVNTPASWLWYFGDGSTSTSKNPVHTYYRNGNYSVKLVAGNSIGKDSLTQVNYITVSKPNGPATKDTFICSNSSLILKANGIGTINWYNVPGAGSVIHTGASYTTPVLSTTTTYYTESTIADPVKSIGKPDFSGAGGYFSNATDQYMIFDVYAPILLSKVTVYATGAAPRVFEWRSSSGTVLKDTTINLLDGTNVVSLNWRLTPGLSYRMGINGIANLFRNKEEASINYPYTAAGYVSITGTSVGTSGYYYYFYNWQLQPYSCVSERNPITVYIGKSQHPLITPSGNISICTGQSITLTAPGGGINYKWSDGESSRAINVNTTGNYSVIIKASGGCSDTSALVSVNINPIPQSQFTFSSSGSNISFTNTSTGAASYTWSFGDNTQADTTKNPTHIYSGSNNYTVTLVACNGGCCDSSSQNINVLTGINTVKANADINVYPNPTADKLFIQLDEIITDPYSAVKLVNLLGQQLPVNLSFSDNHLILLDVSTLAAGTYFLSINSGTIDKTVKVIKVND